MSLAETIETNAASIEQSADDVKEAAAAVQDAANTIETKVSKNIQPDISDLRVNVSGLNDSANVRQKRLLWGMWAMLGLHTLTIILILAK